MSELQRLVMALESGAGLADLGGIIGRGSVFAEALIKSVLRHYTLDEKGQVKKK